MELLLVFRFISLSQSTITTQVSGAILNYFDQSSTIYAQLSSQFSQYSYEQINKTAIENSIQISNSQFITYYSSMSRVLVLEGGSSISINPNSVFSNLTISVFFCVTFEIFNQILSFLNNNNKI